MIGAFAWTLFEFREEKNNPRYARTHRHTGAIDETMIQKPDCLYLGLDLGQ
jgi:hypothetical protein